MGDQRSTCWSITINNPKDDEYKIVLPARWKLEGQIERGEQGTEHFQGMLNTPQVRFAAVKKVFPRAHIEVARNKVALARYVHKEETRVASVEAIPTLFEYQTIVAKMWNEDVFKSRWNAAIARASQTFIPDIDDVAMCYLDTIVADDIDKGRRGAEFIAINPMWRSSWKKFWRNIINRHASSQQAVHETPAPGQYGPQEGETHSGEECGGVGGGQADVTAGE